MKKLSKSIIGVTLACPIITLPLINATHIVKQKFETNEETQDYAFGTQGSTYTCKFFNTTSAKNRYAVVWAVNMARDVELSLPIPATVMHNNVEFPVKKIDTFGRTGSSETAEIDTLDLSQAYNLEEICDNAFSLYEKEAWRRKGSMIKWIKFGINPHFKKIGNNAFRSQSINKQGVHTYDVLDMSRTDLRKIGTDAFADSCWWEATTDMKGIVFPRNIEQFDSDAFWYKDVKRSSPRFDKIVFTKRKPNRNLFANEGSCPLMTANSPLTVVPYGSLDAYKKLDHISSDMKESLYESNIDFDIEGKSSQGSKKLAGICGKSGIDKDGRWVPYNVKTKKLDEDCSYRLTNDYGGKIKLNKRNQITWTNDLPAGTYKFRVMAIKYDNPKHTKFSVAESDQEVTLTIVKSAKLMGGSKWLFGTSLEAGQDDKLWSTYVEGYTPSSVNYQLQDLPEELNNRVHVDDTTDQKARITWDANIPAGNYKFSLQAEIDIGLGQKIFIQEPISLSITGVGLSFDMTICDSDGHEITDVIDLTHAQKEYTFHIKTDVIVGTQPKTVNRPQFSLLSLQGITIGDDPSGTQGRDYFFNLNKNDFPKGETRFHVYTTAEIEDGEGNPITIQLVSNTITVKNDREFGDTAPSIPTEIDIGKNSDGNCTFNVLGISSSDRITGTAIYFPQYVTPTGKITATHTNNSITLSWDKEFAVGIESLPTVRDIGLEIKLRNDDKQYDGSLRLSISFAVYNEGKIEYNGNPVLLSYAEQKEKKIVTSTPVEFKVNGHIPDTPGDISYGIVVAQDTQSNKYSDYISVEPISGDNTRANILVGNIIEDETTLNGLDVKLYAYYDKLIVYDTYDFTLYVGNQLAIQNLPKECKVQMGVAKDFGSIWTTWNGEVVKDQAFVIEGPVADGFVVEDGHLKWTGKTEGKAGTFDMSVLATKEYSSKSYQDRQWITVTLEEAPKKNNTGLIIGCSIGGAAVVAGAAAGITVGVKKHKAKPKVNKK